MERPEAERVESRRAETEPLPFVPAMWTTGIERGGKKESKEVIRSRPGLMDMAEREGGRCWERWVDGGFK